VYMYRVDEKSNMQTFCSFTAYIDWFSKHIH